jgi:hypothetical protein
MSHNEVDEEVWSPVSRTAAFVLMAFAAWVVWVHCFTQEQWVMLLDWANLALHEAGHPVVAMASSNLAVYGGTIFQLIFPALFIHNFWRRRHSLGWMACIVWLGASLLNVARYMRDARAQVLPLIGGGEHDWTEIFSRWGVLQHDLGIGRFVQVVGLCIISYAFMQAWRAASSVD